MDGLFRQRCSRTGSDAPGVISRAAPAVPGCRRKIHPHIWKGEVGVTGTYGIVQFELFAPQPREFLNYERSVGALHDGTRWCFEVQGTVQPYEEVDQYSARKIRDRFTPEMLERYCSALGIRIFDETFYRGPGLLVVNQDPLAYSSDREQ